MATTPALGRPSDRKNLIAGYLRTKIVSGELAPGAQLPTRSEIETLFQASPGTVQSALEQLRRDGFTMVKGRQGTFVTVKPPHLTNYALVFPTFPQGLEHQWRRFWTALSNEAANLRREEGVQIASYYAVDEHHDSEDFHRLEEEVAAHRLAGIIFASPTKLLHGTSIVDAPGIPRVSIASKEPAAHVSTVTLSQLDFWDRALRMLAERGKRRVAMIHAPLEPEQVAQLKEMATAYGLEAPEYWRHTLSLAAPEAARNLTHLLFRQSGAEVPDALVIADDNLVEEAIAGMLQSGRQVPTEVEVVAHCNFPWPVPSPLPVHRLGFDAHQVLKTCLAMLAELRAENAPVQHAAIPARFESEFQEARAETAFVR